jgi:hypothetical protein
MENVSALIPAAQHHAVRFYNNDKSLAQIVAQFLSEGLAAGNPAIVVATPAHRGTILKSSPPHRSTSSGCSVRTISYSSMPRRRCQSS